MMTTQTNPPHSADYDRIEAALHYLEVNFKQQPSLEEIAESVHLSKHHFQRLFKRWAGVSPTQFMHFMTVEYAKTRLAEANSILETSLDVGLSSPSRLHDLFVTFEAMTPGEYKQNGAGVTVHYGVHTTPFGEMVLAATQRGICGLRFVGEAGPEPLIEEIKAEWARATVLADPAFTEPVVDRLFGATPSSQTPLPLLVKGTNFQLNVWQALLNLPSGSLVTYSDVAALIDRPSATRAVASAIARNPIGYVIPCHRVINKIGRMHNYRWGSARKKAIVGWEASRRLQSETIS